MEKIIKKVLLRLCGTPLRNIKFACARATRNEKRRNLHSDQSKRKFSAAALLNKEYDQMVDLWNEDNPDGLQSKFFYMAAHEVAWRGGEGYNLKIYLFVGKQDHMGWFTGSIEYNPIFTKTIQGGFKKIVDSKWLVANQKSPKECPVRLFKKTKGKKNKFYHYWSFIFNNPNWNNLDSKGWFKNSPAGKNTISSWLRSSAKKIGINAKQTKVTNYSARARLLRICRELVLKSRN